MGLKINGIPVTNLRISTAGQGGGLDTSDATASAGDILSPKTAYANGQKVTGSIPSVPGRTVTPSASSQTAIQTGRYAVGDIAVAGDANLVPGNIKSGVSIFGVSGNYSAEYSPNPTTININTNSQLNSSIIHRRPVMLEIT